MTIRLTATQVEEMRKIRRGINQCPPLRFESVRALMHAGFVESYVEGEKRCYRLTEKGQDFR